MSLTHTNQEFFNADTRMIHCLAQGYDMALGNSQSFHFILFILVELGYG